MLNQLEKIGNKSDWIITDHSVGQRCKILSDSEFLFEEGDREEVINLKDYSLEQMVVACEGYGYDSTQVFEWLVGGVDDKILIAECIFEMEM